MCIIRTERSPASMAKRTTSVSEDSLEEPQTSRSDPAVASPLWKTWPLKSTLSLPTTGKTKNAGRTPGVSKFFRLS